MRLTEPAGLGPGLMLLAHSRHIPYQALTSDHLRLVGAREVDLAICDCSLALTRIDF